MLLPPSDTAGFRFSNYTVNPLVEACHVYGMSLSYSLALGSRRLPPCYDSSKEKGGGMYERVFRWIEVGVLTVVTIAVGGAIFIMFPALKSEAAAAWVQAVGSIAAIGVAIWVSHKQVKQQRTEADQKRQQEYEEALVLFQLVLIQAINFLANVRTQVQHMHAGVGYVPDRPTLEDIRSTLQSIPIARIDQRTIARVFTVKRVLSEYHVRFEATNAFQIQRGESIHWLDDSAANFKSLLQDNNRLLVEKGIEIP